MGVDPAAPASHETLADPCDRVTISRRLLSQGALFQATDPPSNLGDSGDEILLEARIITVADVVEAMASHRPYREALGIDKALKEISSNEVHSLRLGSWQSLMPTMR